MKLRSVVLFLVFAAMGSSLFGRQSARVPPRPPLVQPGSGAAEPIAPPDGVWLVDEEGNEYFEEPHAKIEGAYRRNDDGTVRLRWGLTFTPVREDDEFFYVRINRPQHVERPDQYVTATAEDVAAIKERYRGTATVGTSLRFEPLTGTLPSSGQWRNGFALGDVNGDGILDIAHGPIRKGDGLPRFLLGDGHGNFEAWAARFDLRHRLDYGDVALADFDGDGKLDAAYACHLMGVMVLRNAGEGQFTPWSQGIDFNVPGQGGAGESFSSRAIAAGDMDGDGRPDLIVLGEGPKVMGQMLGRAGGAAVPGSQGSFGVRIYRNEGNGKWSHGPELLPEVAGDTVLVADVNGNGKLDIVVSTISTTDEPFILLQTSRGKFEALPTALPGRGLVKAVALHDLDGDGKLDLIVSRQIREIDGWHSTIEVVWAVASKKPRRELLTGELTLVYSLAAGDVDGDGVADIVAGTGLGRIAVLRGMRQPDRSVRYELQEAPELGIFPYSGCNGYHVAVVELDGEPGAEILASFASDRCLNEGRIEGWRARLIEVPSEEPAPSTP